MCVPRRLGGGKGEPISGATVASALHPSIHPSLARNGGTPAREVLRVGVKRDSLPHPILLCQQSLHSPASLTKLLHPHFLSHCRSTEKRQGAHIWPDGKEELCHDLHTEKTFFELLSKDSPPSYPFQLSRPPFLSAAKSIGTYEGTQELFSLPNWLPPTSRNGRYQSCPNQNSKGFYTPGSA